MYARLVLVTVDPGMRSTGEEFVKLQDPAVRAQRGFKGVTYLANDETGEYGAFVLWESKEDAEAGYEVLFPRLQKAMGDIVKGPPVTTLFEVLEAPA